MRFSCPTCNQIVQVPDEAAGQIVACPTCQQRLKAPGAPHVTSQPRPAPAPAPEPPAAPAPRRRDSRDDRDWDDRDDRGRGRSRSRRDDYDDDYDEYDREPRPRQPNIGLAITALVLGIVGVVFSWCVFIGPICAILGIIFGGIHMSHKGEAGNGLAIGGLASGGAGLLFFIIFMIVALSSGNPVFWNRF